MLEDQSRQYRSNERNAYGSGLPQANKKSNLARRATTQGIRPPAMGVNRDDVAFRNTRTPYPMGDVMAKAAGVSIVLDDEEDTYVDMRVASSSSKSANSTPQRSKTVLSRNSPNMLPRSPMGGSHRYESSVKRGESFTPRTRPDYISIKSPYSSTISLGADDDDYADMSGASTPRDSSSSPNNMRPRTAHAARSMISRSVTGSQARDSQRSSSRSAISNQRSFSQSSLFSDAASSRPVRSTSNPQIVSPPPRTPTAGQVLQRGLYDDDDDDYQEMSPMKKPDQQKPSTHERAVNQPAPKMNIFQSTSLTNLTQKVSIPSKRFGFSDSSEEDEAPSSANKERTKKSNANFRSKSVNDCSVGKKEVSSRNDTSTDAGMAARKYLQHNDPRLFSGKADIKRSSSSAGVKRSTSRAGKQGAVASRITKIRQNHPAKQQNYDLDDDDDEDDYVSIENHTKPQSTSSSSDLGDKSKTLMTKEDLETLIREKDPQLLGKENVDGSLLMKLLAGDARSQSLDKKYLDWLAKTSPYASRHSSTSGTPDGKRGIKGPDLKSPSSSEDEHENVYEDADREAFRNFAKSVSSGYRQRVASSTSSDAVTPGKNAVPLGQFADQYSKETKSSSLEPSKVKGDVEKDIKALKTAMTLKPVTRSDNVEFSDLAEAFFNDHKKETDKKGKKKKSDKKLKEKKSLRKSFKFGSRKKLVDVFSGDAGSDKSEASPVRDAERQSNLHTTTPQGLTPMKPPMGLSPNHARTNSLKRDRAASSSVRDRIDDQSGDNSSKTGTLERNTKSSLAVHTSPPESFSRNGSLRRDGSLSEMSDWENNLRNAKPISKSSTLGRLFSKKGKERKGLDVTDSAALFAPNGLSLESPDYYIKGKGTMERRRTIEADLTPSQRYFRRCRISKGFVVSHNAEEETEGIDISFLEAKRLSDARPVNKYATITSMYSLTQQRGSPESNHRKTLSRHLSTDPIIGRSASPERRKKHARASLRGASPSSRTSSPPGMPYSSKLDEVDVVSQLQNKSAPLYPKPRQHVSPIYSEASARTLAAARLLYQQLIKTQPALLRQHKTEEEDDVDLLITGNDTYDQCAFGHELVTWLYANVRPRLEERDLGGTTSKSRWNTCGMWQLLHEEGLIKHVRNERFFEDSSYLYQFHKDVLDYVDRDGVSKDDSTSIRSSLDSGIAQVNGDYPYDEFHEASSRSSSIVSASRMMSGEMTQMMLNDIDLTESLTYLQQNAPDALFRIALRKSPNDRSSDELMMIYEEILHIKALANLSDSVKRELAGVLQFEHHQHKGTVLFNQGDEGTSWYIVLKGSVEVVIHGKGVVCTLKEGDDFGNLAIINDAPRAASILLAEHNCQFLKVDKFDFVRILRDVEANTVRLKEHGKDVLILQKIHARTTNSQQSRDSITTPPQFPVAATPTRHSHKYSISAGTVEKILEHILEYLQPWNIGRREEAMEDFIIMHPVFTSTSRLCELLIKHFRSEDVDKVECSRSIKRKVIYFTVRWSHMATDIFLADPSVENYLQELHEELDLDVLNNSTYSILREDLNSLYDRNENESLTNDKSKQIVLRVGDVFQRLMVHRALRRDDLVFLTVYNLKVQQAYTTVKVSMSADMDEIINLVAERRGMSAKGMILYEVKEDGDVYEINKKQTSIPTSLKVNSRLFICTQEEKSSLGSVMWTCPRVTGNHLEIVSSLEVAYHVTQYDWELLNNIHVMEFVYKVFGAHKYKSVTSNLDLFTRRFNELAYWAPTEICSCPNLNKRVQLLRKFIKIAQHLKMYQNMNGFMAMMIGIGNQAVSRMSLTWEKLPAKYRKMVQEYEAILDPSRNHRSYRIHVSTLQSPIILYLPLLLKDMTFQHEGNESVKEGLVNFEKMHMISNSIRSVIQGCETRIDTDSILETTKTAAETKSYVSQLKVITDQKVLNEMSNKLEPRR